MIDYSKITVTAGRGGRGSGSRMQIKGKRYGRADGGDGGKGADVYFEASNQMNTLETYRFLKHYEAENGQPGASQLRRGANGKDLILKVPVGTVISFENTTNGSNKPYRSDTSYDLTQEGQKVLIATGGHGGKGNAHLRDEFGRRPKTGEPGEEGERVEITLELKSIADIGLIGLPNAGKSTLLAALTAAKPAIAPYPFTTIEPNLGVLQNISRSSETAALKKGEPRSIERVNQDISGISGTANQQVSDSDSETPTHRPTEPPSHRPTDRLIIADIPGLIEGASRGKGLGDLFLKHIERTKVLVHLLDISSTDIWHDYGAIRQELKNYSKGLPRKREIVVLNKIDLVPREKVKEVLDQFKKKRKKAVAISAKTGEGLKGLVKVLQKTL